jgi:hypothetical protein
MGMTGGGYWVYSYANFWGYDRSLPPEWGSVYVTETGPVTTRRWEASRDGIEDFELLTMLKARTARGASAEERAGAQLLDEAVAFVTAGQEHVSDIGRQLRPYTPSYTKWMEYRTRIIDSLVKLGTN